MLKKFLFLIALSICMNCSSTPETYTVETIDGVRHVHNIAPKGGDESRIELEFVQKIGELEGEDENYNLHQIREVEKDKDGNYYILDAGNKRVQKYGPDGKYLLTIGGEGQGPGEFMSPVSISVNEANVLFVCENQTRLEKFSIDGTHLESKKLDQQTPFIRSLGKDRLLTSYYKVSNSGHTDSAETAFFNIADINGKRLKNIGRIMQHENFMMQVFLNIKLLTGDENEYIYLNFPFHNRIEMYSPMGDLKTKIDRVLNYEIDHKAKVITREGTNFQWPTAEMTDVSYGIGVDHKNRIWVMTYTAQEVKDESGEIIKPSERILEVFNNDGILLCRIDIPDRKLRFLGVKNDSILFKDTNGISVYDYKIVAN